MKRRNFLKQATSAAGLLGARSLAPAYAAQAEDALKGEKILEPARETPLAEPPCDVIVCGAGPAGVTAAIASAKAGARTRLIEAQGCLGGIWTSGLMAYILDCKNKSGFMRRLTKELGRMAEHPGGGLVCDPEGVKYFLEKTCMEAGAQIRLHTRVAAAMREGGRRLKYAITESKSGREAWAAKVFIDATGDGDLAAQAGCGFDWGREGSGETQPMSLICLVTGLPIEAVRNYVTTVGPDHAAHKKALLEELKRAGAEPSYTSPSLFWIGSDLHMMMANHEYGMSGINARQLTEATLRGRAELNRMIPALRALGGAWANITLVATAAHIGVREGRRIHGRYTVTIDDLTEGRRHEDAVCQCAFGIDVHSTDPQKTKGIMNAGKKSKPYDIPLRSLIAKDADNLIITGRCISGDFLAHSSYRVTGDAVAMGQAAGVLAALAAKSDRPPHAVPWADVKKGLEMEI